jgi:hypothetical protein
MGKPGGKNTERLSSLRSTCSARMPSPARCQTGFENQRVPVCGSGRLIVPPAQLRRRLPVGTVDIAGRRMLAVLRVQLIDRLCESACFYALDPTDGFTLGLCACLNSSEFQLLAETRNMLLHTLAPGRAVRVLKPNAPHEIDLDLWRGNWIRALGGTMPQPKLKFLLGSDALIKQRDRIDGQLESLSSALSSLAGKHGLI